MADTTKKQRISASSISFLLLIAVLIGVLVASTVAAIAMLSAEYDKSAPVTIEQQIPEAVDSETWFTLQFKNTSTNETYRQAIKIPAKATLGSATVMLDVYAEYEITLVDNQSTWRYENETVAYSNPYATGGNDEWAASAADAGNTKLPATIKLGTLDKPVTERKITLTSKATNINYYFDTTSVVNTITFPTQYKVVFDNCGHGNEIKNQYVFEGECATEPDIGTSEGLKFEGWYTDEHFTTKWAGFDTAITADTTLYANWVPDESGDEQVYWLAAASKMTTANTAAATSVSNAYPANANGKYYGEEKNIKKSAAEIRADVDVLSDTNHTKYDWTVYQSVYNEWAGYMTADNYHLYTKIGSGTAADDYVEFRVINVGEHTANGQGDGSVLTFQAIHALPSAYSMNAQRTNAGGFGASALAENLNSGSIFSLFKPGFTDDVAEVSKNYMPNGNQTTNAVSANFKLWLLSYSELITENTQYDNWLSKYNLLEEGSQ